MLRSEMQQVIRKINSQQREFERLERASDRAFERGDKEKADRFDQDAHYAAGVRNGMIELMAALGFRIEEKVGTLNPLVWELNQHDELKLH